MQDRDRAYRRAQRRRIIDNRKRFLMEREGPNGILAFRPDGKMAERHPYDCGHRCLMCHGVKLLENGSRRLATERQWQNEIEQGYFDHTTY